MYDLLIKNGTVVTEAGNQQLDVGVRDGKIAELAPDLSTAPASEKIDASGKLVFPGFIDAHTHMGIPIMDTHSCDDFQSGSIAAACGGVTTIVDFTVQQPGHTLRESLDERLGKASGKSHVDYALHVNVTDRAEERLPEIPVLVQEGFEAYKVFSTYRQAGMMLTWPQFGKVLKTVSEAGGLLFLHAEDNDLVEKQTGQNCAAGHKAAIYHARNRTPEAEGMAVTRAAQIAGELKAPLYIVHLSSRAGLEAGMEAKDRGVKLILETCPQYLVLSQEKYLEENGHFWITTPPLRTQDDSAALWHAISEGQIEVVATDHCPFTIRQKNSGGGAFDLTPNGIPGVETLFPLLYTYGVVGGKISLSRLVQVLAKRPAELLGIDDRKGAIAVGADADLVVWDPEITDVIVADKLHGNADWSPYEGMKVSGRLDYTILRGDVIVEHGEFVGDDMFGNLLRAAK